MVVKLDMENAFDNVHHSFLFVVMRTNGFTNHLTFQISACISGPQIAPLVNGRPRDFFQSSRGLRQGCRLSLLLYVIMTYSLSRKIESKHLSGRLSRISIVRGVKELNHSQFTNDTLLLGGSSLPIVDRFNVILQHYLEVSGGVVNNRKCNIFGQNFSKRRLRTLASNLNFSFSEKWHSFTYLGIPIFPTRPKFVDWKNILDKIRKKLSR